MVAPGIPAFFDAFDRYLAVPDFDDRKTVGAWQALIHARNNIESAGYAPLPATAEGQEPVGYVHRDDASRIRNLKPGTCWSGTITGQIAGSEPIYLSSPPAAPCPKCAEHAQRADQAVALMHSTARAANEAREAAEARIVALETEADEQLPPDGQNADTRREVESQRFPITETDRGEG